jgi:hypothetical protein
MLAILAPVAPALTPALSPAAAALGRASDGHGFGRVGAEPPPPREQEYSREQREDSLHGEAARIASTCAAESDDVLRGVAPPPEDQDSARAAASRTARFIQ